MVKMDILSRKKRAVFTYTNRDLVLKLLFGCRRHRGFISLCARKAQKDSYAPGRHKRIFSTGGTKRNTFKFAREARKTIFSDRRDKKVRFDCRVPARHFGAKIPLGESQKLVFVPAVRKNRFSGLPAERT